MMSENKVMKELMYQMAKQQLAQVLSNRDITAALPLSTPFKDQKKPRVLHGCAHTSTRILRHRNVPSNKSKSMSALVPSGATLKLALHAHTNNTDTKEQLMWLHVLHHQCL